MVLAKTRLNIDVLRAVDSLPQSTHQVESVGPAFVAQVAVVISSLRRVLNADSPASRLVGRSLPEHSIDVLWKNVLL